VAASSATTEYEGEPELIEDSRDKIEGRGAEEAAEGEDPSVRPLRWEAPGLFVSDVVDAAGLEPRPQWPAIPLLKTWVGSLRSLRVAVRVSIEGKQTAKPFKWMYTGKVVAV